MPRIKSYLKNLRDNDPNQQSDSKYSHNVRCPNDFVDWDSLHGEVITVVWTKEQLEKYTKDKEG